MRRATLLAFALVLSLLAAPTWGQPSDETPVVVGFSVDPAEAAPGSLVEVRATAEIHEGWHIYGAGETQGIPSKLETTPPQGASLAGAAAAPKPILEEVPYLGKMQLLRGKVTFRQKVRLPATASGELVIPLAFTSQACSEGEGGVCLPPETAQGEVRVALVAGAEAPANGGGEAPDGGPGFSVDPFGTPEETEIVTLEASVEPAKVAPGGWVEVRLTATVAESWHIFATDETNALPTRLELSLPGGLSQGGGLASAPAAVEKKDPNLGALRMHEGTVTFTQKVQVAAGAAAGNLPLSGSLEWQGCDPSTCVSGSSAFSLEVAVDPSAGAGVAPPEGAQGARATASAKSDQASNPLGLILASIGLGLAMLLMPCTYPMIPITVSLFSKGKSLPRHKSLMRAGIYAGGIVVSFVAVGGLVQVIAGAQGQGAINAFAANAWVNLLIGAVFVYFAFSFFGYYELGMPGFLQRLMQLGSAKRDSDGTVPTWSLFLMGLFFVLTSYTCGAPVVFGLFATAASDPHPLAILGATLVFSLTVAIPFFALALVPGGMRLMPKSGSWFTVFKAVLGFVELGFAVKFFRGTDLQWDFVNLLPRPVTLVLWVLLCVAAAVYLHGYFPLKFPHQPDLRQWSWRRYAWGWAFVGLAVYFGSGIGGRSLAPSVEAFILPDPEVGEEEGTVVFGLPYHTDLPALERAKAQAREAGKPALLMFTGHYCPNCVQMEKGVLEDERVMKRIEDVGRVALFIDKENDPVEGEHKQLMLERYNKSGAIPAFFVIDGAGEIRSSQIGNCSTEAFLEFLAAGGL